MPRSWIHLHVYNLVTISRTPKRWELVEVSGGQEGGEAGKYGRAVPGGLRRLGSLRSH